MHSSGYSNLQEEAEGLYRDICIGSSLLAQGNHTSAGVRREDAGTEWRVLSWPLPSLQLLALITAVPIFAMPPPPSWASIAMQTSPEAPTAFTAPLPPPGHRPLCYIQPCP